MPMDTCAYASREPAWDGLMVQIVLTSGLFALSAIGTFGNQPYGSNRDRNELSRFCSNGGLSALRTLVRGAAKGDIEPKLPDAARRSNGSNAREIGRSVIVRYAYS